MVRISDGGHVEIEKGFACAGEIERRGLLSVWT